MTCTFVDPVRRTAVTLDTPCQPGQIATLGDVLAHLWAIENRQPTAAAPLQPGAALERCRFADGLFLLTDEGQLGELIPGLRFKIAGRTRSLADPIPPQPNGEPVSIEIDRSQTGYSRRWPAYLQRRWMLRRSDYEGFVRSILDRAYPRDSESILRLDTPERVRRFLSAVARRIYDAPYETYSRFLDRGAPFKSCDQTLDNLLVGDGGNCSEKAMAMYLIAHAYGINTEIVLGGEDAKGPLPYAALRSILDERQFDSPHPRHPQRFWQHYSLLCHPTPNPDDDVFCDVAGSNIPFLCVGAKQAVDYLDPARRRSTRVVITLEPIQLFYQPIAQQQDLALDLFYAMEHFIEDIDIIHAIDNELGLLHTGDFWVGALAYRDAADLARLRREYERFVRKARRDPATDLCFVDEPLPAHHPLVEHFHEAHPAGLRRVNESATGLRQRIHETKQGASTCFVFMKLRERVELPRTS